MTRTTDCRNWKIIKGSGSETGRPLEYAFSAVHCVQEHFSDAEFLSRFSADLVFTFILFLQLDTWYRCKNRNWLQFWIPIRIFFIPRNVWVIRASIDALFFRSYCEVHNSSHYWASLVRLWAIPGCQNQYSSANYFVTQCGFRLLMPCLIYPTVSLLLIATYMFTELLRRQSICRI